MAVPEKWEKRYFIISGNIMIVLAPLLIGPSKVLSIPETPFLVGIGLFIGGVSRSMIGSYSIPEAINGG